MAFPYNELPFRGIKNALYISYGAFPVIDAYNTNAWGGFSEYKCHLCTTLTP